MTRSRASAKAAGNGCEWETVGNGCECWVNPHPWTYYGIPEPGDCIEYNPDCPEHGETQEGTA